MFILLLCNTNTNLKTFIIFFHIHDILLHNSIEISIQVKLIQLLPGKNKLISFNLILTGNPV